MSVCTLSQLAQLLHLEFTGPGETPIAGVCSVEEAKADCLSFVENARQIKSLKVAPAALIAPPDTTWDRPLLISPKPRVAFARAIEFFHPERPPRPGIHPTATVSPDASISAQAEIGPLCVVEGGATIGDGVILDARVVVGKDSLIESGSRIFPGVVLGEGVRVGPGCIIDAHARLTAGTVVEERVYVGVHCVLQGCCIGKGTKMDNLCFVGEGSRIGPHSIFVSKAQVGKNVTTGPYFLIAAISCVGDGVTVGPVTQVAGHSWVDRSWTEPKLQLAGEPAKLLKAEVKERAIRLRAAKTLQGRRDQS